MITFCVTIVIEISKFLPTAQISHIVQVKSAARITLT